MNKKNLKWEITIALAMFIGITTIFVYSFDFVFSSGLNMINGLLLYLIGIFAVKETIFSCKTSFSINSFNWLFIFFFCTIAPIIQCKSGIMPWHLEIDSTLLFQSILLLIVWLIVYKITMKVKKRKVHNKISLEALDKNNFINDIVLCIISLVATYMCISYYGFENLFSRLLANDNLDLSEGKAITLIMTHFIRNIPLCVCTIEIIRHKKIYNPFVLISLTMTIITKCPTGIGRFNLAVAYIGLFIIAFPSFFKSRKWFEILLAIGLLYVFPVINIFRYVDFHEVEFNQLIQGVSNLSDSYVSGDFDAFSIFMRTIDSINKNGPVWGAVLGSLFFFIPRSIWVKKPVGSGTYIAQMQGLSFDNLSCPIFAEGYLNGGIIGLIIFAIIFARITKILDERYWSNINDNKFKSSYLYMVYPYLLGYFFTTGRGALISCFAYTIGFLITALIIFLISHHVVINKEMY